MIEIATAVSLASSAYGAIKKAMETGQEVEDMIGYFGKFFDAKEQLSEANMKASTSSFVGKMFNSGSVESQALEVTAARHKIMAIEKELREFLIYTGQIEFYEDMMKENIEVTIVVKRSANIRRHFGVLAFPQQLPGLHVDGIDRALFGSTD